MYDIGAKRTKQPVHGHERGEITQRCDSSRNVDRGKTDARNTFERIRAFDRARDQYDLVPGSDQCLNLAAQMMQQEKRDSGKSDDTHCGAIVCVLIYDKRCRRDDADRPTFAGIGGLLN
jgi:hypothetical protein